MFEWLPRGASHSPTPRSNRSRRYAHLRLEELEVRTVPSVLTPAPLESPPSWAAESVPMVLGVMASVKQPAVVAPSSHVDDAFTGDDLGAGAVADQDALLASNNAGPSLSFHPLIAVAGLAVIIVRGYWSAPSARPEIHDPRRSP